MSKHKVNAFTILEMTVAMLISAIVIGITYATFTIVYKSYNLYHNKHEEMAVALRLNELLIKDFKKADVILKDTNGLVFKDTNSLVTYRFNDSAIIRTAGIIDTFKIKTGALSTSYEGAAIEEVTAIPERNRVDEINFNTIIRDEKIPYHYYKQYSSANLIQRLPDALY